MAIDAYALSLQHVADGGMYAAIHRLKQQFAVSVGDRHRELNRAESEQVDYSLTLDIAEGFGRTISSICQGPDAACSSDASLVSSASPDVTADMDHWLPAFSVARERITDELAQTLSCDFLFPSRHRLRNK